MGALKFVLIIVLVSVLSRGEERRGRGNNSVQYYVAKD